MISVVNTSGNEIVFDKSERELSVTTREFLDSIKETSGVSPLLPIPSGVNNR